MALDTLWFDLDLDDQKLQQKITKIKSDLANLGVNTENIKISINRKALEGDIKEALKNGGNPFEIQVSVNKQSIENSVRNALNIAYGGGSKFSADDARQARTAAQIQAIASREADAHSIAMEKLAAASARAEKAQMSLASAHQRATQGVDSHVNANVRLGQSMAGLISISGDLRNQIGMLVSAYTVEHLLKNVVEIGGEFEKQKLATGSMLGSLEQADDIFNRMKNLALTSPFNFKDLSNYSRQLTAFGTPYKDLYDTTNRLADISAGLGGDMSRLVLAFSQVKAAAYLRGQEMRQFTEFGVSLPDLLAKKYSEAEHRIVTAGDVIERVSKRMVSFNDVKDVLWKSTDKGGQFYGMQDVLAQSTSGMASNLKDAIDTMYYDIANSNSGVIKESIKGIASLVGKWRELASALVAGTAVYSAHRLAMTAHNRLIGQGTAETIKGVYASKAEEASILRRKALLGELSAEEKNILANENMLTTSDLKRLATSKAINADAVIRLVNSKKITASQALEIASIVGLSSGQKKYIYDLQVLDAQLAKTTGFWDRLGISMQKVSMMSANKVGSAMAGIGSSLSKIFSKSNILMAAAFVGLDAWMSDSQRKSQIDDSNKQAIKNAEDGVKSINEFLDANPIEIKIKQNDPKEINSLIQSYRNELLSQPIDMSGVIINIDSISDTTKKLEALKKELETLRDADKNMANSGNVFSMVQKEKYTGFFRTLWQGLHTTNQGVGDFLQKIGLISEGFRYWSTAGDEANRNIEDVISDLSSSLDTLKFKISELSEKEIQDAVNLIKERIPSIGKSIQSMIDTGSTKVDIGMAISEVEYNTGESFLPNLDATAINKYKDAYNAVYYQFSEMAKSSLELYNSTMDKADVEGKTEKWALGWRKAIDEQGKNMKLQGESLKIWRFINEETISKLSFKIKDHPQVWRDMYDGIKQILSRNGIDIKNATKEQVNAAFQVYKNETEKVKPYLADMLNSLNIYSKKHPIYIWSEMSSIGKLGAIQLEGRGLELSKDPTLKKKYRSALENIKNDKDASDYIKSQYDVYQQDLKDAKSNRKKISDINKKWDEFKRDWDKLMDVDYIIGGQKTPKAKKTGNKTDELLKSIQNSSSRLKQVQELFNKYLGDNYGEDKALEAVRKSGMSYANVLGEDIKNKSQYDEWYIGQLTKLINRLSSNKRKLTDERRKEIDELRKQRSEITGEISKTEFENTISYYKDEMDKIGKQWDDYKKLVDSGMKRIDASMFVFGTDKSDISATQDKASRLYAMMRGEGFKGNLDFNNTLEEAKKIFGSQNADFKNSPNYKMFFDLWKQLKSEIENDKIQIQIDSNKAKEQIQGIADNIKSVIDKALGQSVAIYTSMGVQATLSDYAELNKDTGLLQITEDAKKNLSPEEIGDINNRIEVANQEITKLSSSLLELLPAWDDIFGKEAYKSLSTLLRGMREAREIISNAKVVKDRSGKPSYFTSSYRDVNGNVQSVTGNISELDRLKNQQDTLQGDINKKNPFVGMFESFKDYVSSKKTDKYWNGIADQADKYGGVTTYRDDKGKLQTITSSEAKTKANNAQDQASKSALSFSEAMQGAISEMQKWNNALSLLGSTIEALGGGEGISDAAGVAGGMLSGASSMAALGPYGMAAGAAMGAITSIAGLHDKKLDRAIEKSKQKMQELQGAYKAIEDSLKYHLGNAAEGTIINNSQIEKVKEAQRIINEIKSGGSISIWDLQNIEEYNKVLKDNWATLKYMQTGNAYNYQRDLYKQQLEQLKKQKQAEEDKKKTDQSKINDYNSQIEETETKIAQFSLDLANSLYGIDIKGWASQLGDALFEAWQKGESGADAFNKKANDIIASVANKWATQSIIEPAMQKLMDDMVGKDGQGGWLGADNDMSMADMINSLAPDILGVQTSIDTYNKAMTALNEGFKKQGINMQNTSSSSTANAISGVTEQEANIIAAYMDAIRQDTYNNRMNLQKMVDEGIMVSESPIMRSQLQQLQSIASNTYKNMELVGEIKSMFYDITIGNKKIYIN